VQKSPGNGHIQFAGIMPRLVTEAAIVARTDARGYAALKSKRQQALASYWPKDGRQRELGG
jgi:hypothetical protein